MTQDKVLVEIHLDNTTWRIVTRYDEARDFIEAWQSTDGESIVEISGVADELSSSNDIQFTLKKEAIDGVMIREIK
jgi:hypothetical protein